MAVQTVVKISEEEITLLRQGDLQMKQVFRPGERSESVYHSPYGRLIMETVTDRLQMEQRDNRPLSVSLSYRMWLNGQDTGEYTLEMDIIWAE